jgi:hypothetical protein
MGKNGNLPLATLIKLGTITNCIKIISLVSKKTDYFDFTHAKNIIIHTKFKVWICKIFSANDSLRMTIRVHKVTIVNVTLAQLTPLHL